MTLRTARQGPNAGNQFWGCSKFPACKGTRPFEGATEETGGAAESSDGERESSKGSDLVPVDWRDGTPRLGWESLYVSVGAVPGFLARASDAFKSRRVEGLLGDTAVFRNTSNAINATSQDGCEFIVQIALKLLQRGSAPLPTLGLETAAAKELSLLGLSQADPNAPEIDWSFSPPLGKVTESGLLSVLSERNARFVPDPMIGLASSEQCGYDSERELLFATELLPAARPDLAHWLVGQVAFPQLIPEDQALAAARRADFLISHPVLGNYVIEIDGDEHLGDFRIDEERDNALSSSGYKVVRLSNEVIDRRDVDAVREALSSIVWAEYSEPSAVEQQAAKAALICSIGAKVQYVLCDALRRGFLIAGGHWNIRVEGFATGMKEAVSDFITLLSAFDKIYGTHTAPSSVDISLESGGEVKEGLLSICVEPDMGESSAFPDGANGFNYIIRRAYFPRPLKIEMGYSEQRRYCVLAKDRDSNFDSLEESLSAFLQYLFRKREFRPGQLQALVNGLCGHDSIVLLPTGAGKSIIYQLAGLLQPGITLVVDPLVSLIEDQERGLSEYGIERVLGITGGAFSDRVNRQRMLAAVKDAQYHFILMSPERLQTPEFRQTLRALTQHALINCAVIDEA